MLKSQKLKNGARVHLVPFSGTDAATLLVLFKIGSRNEALNVWGGSHFIEHLMFKGTKRRPETVDISRELDRYGAEYNAYTGKDLTGYYVKIDAEKIGVAVDLLSDMLFHSTYDAKEMTREKQVIIEEIKMYEENPIMHIEDLLEEAMFEGHVLGRNIAGTASSMTAMKRDHVLAYRDQFYTPQNMVIVMAGKVPKDALATLEKTFGTVKSKTLSFEENPFPGTKPTGMPRVRLQKKPLEQIQIALGFPTPGRAHKDMDALRLLATILGGTMSSRLFIEVREKRGLCYSVKASVDPYDDVGVFTVRAGLDAERLELAMKVVCQELSKVVKSGVTAKELTMAKDHLRGKLLLQLEDSSNRAEFVARQELFLGYAETLEERMTAIDKLTRKDLARIAKQVLDFRLMSVAAIGPYETEGALLKHFPKSVIKAV